MRGVFGSFAKVARIFILIPERLKRWLRTQLRYFVAAIRIVLIVEFATRETCDGMDGVGTLIGFVASIAVHAENIFRNEKGVCLSKVAYQKKRWNPYWNICVKGVECDRRLV
ncbi:hypothetical protein CCP3SC15_180006 [Gammaproteobacteria bacterium]